MELNPAQLLFLSGKLESGFGSSAQLSSWLEKYFSEPSARQSLGSGDLKDQITNLLVWARSEGKMSHLLQAIADNPPEKSLPDVILAISVGQIRSRQPPAYNRDLFLTKGRPFVDRKELRVHVEQLDGAAPGPDSLLVIEGDKRSGKTHGVRYVKLRVPEHRRLIAVDIADWSGAGSLDAAVLARALCEQNEGDEGDFHGFDPTKEDTALPRLLNWLVLRLKKQVEERGAPIWITVDHCDRDAPSAAALKLLERLAEKVANGDLPDIRLVLACAHGVSLVESLSAERRKEVAALPTVSHIEAWCERVAVEYQRPAARGSFSSFAEQVLAVVDKIEVQLMGFYRNGGTVP